MCCICSPLLTVYATVIFYTLLCQSYENNREILFVLGIMGSTRRMYVGNHAVYEEDGV